MYIYHARTAERRQDAKQEVDSGQALDKMLGVQSIDSNLNHEQHPPPRQERRKYSRPISSLVQKALQTEFQDCVKYI